MQSDKETLSVSFVAISQSQFLFYSFFFCYIQTEWISRLKVFASQKKLFVISINASILIDVSFVSIGIWKNKNKGKKAVRNDKTKL